MTHPKNDNSPQLGDLLAPGILGASPAPRRAITNVWFDRPYDDLICRLASEYGEDATAVLKEFHGNGALARLLRSVLGVPAMSQKMRVYFMRKSWDRTKMTRAEHDHFIADFLSKETDAQGRRLHTIAPDSVRSMAKDGQKELKAEIEERLEGIMSLPDLFLPSRTGSVTQKRKARTQPSQREPKAQN